MKKYGFILAALLRSLPVWSQEAAEPERPVYTHSLKVNALALPYSSINLFYERVVRPGNAFCLIASHAGFPFRYGSVNRTKTRNSSFTAEYRYYAHPTAPYGFYAGPYLKVNRLSRQNAYYTQYPADTWLRIGFGTMAGLQYTARSGFMLGAHAGVGFYPVQVHRHRGLKAYGLLFPYDGRLGVTVGWGFR